MTFLASVTDWFTNAWQNYRVLLLLGGLGVCAFFFIICDAHRNKRKRPRHRFTK